MFRRYCCKSINKGFTILELVVGLAIMAGISLFMGAIFLISFQAHKVAVDKGNVLSNARKAFSGNNKKPGMIVAIQDGQFLKDLSRSKLQISTSQGSSVEYSLVDKILYRNEMGEQIKMAEDIEEIENKYFQVERDGTVIESTTAVLASFVTSKIKVKPKKGKKAVTFYSGAKLKNFQ